ncbi:nucleoside diphosphate-linked moiety X motif 8-like isoform X2 [Actinia tenebrosa]|uniref:Nucleoside diphosphate-linked moiety X motif 8-like isoform X2 n=1 Tax=Actinia tenebrosa TaxID=6105 RepID=A0A6P8HPA1_ACTTE|nr:nucleoside diphosphate-linked moiety X motif 8-like isoform X2 [Actinia tenebrosa]
MMLTKTVSKIIPMDGSIFQTLSRTCVFLPSLRRITLKASKAKEIQFCTLNSRIFRTSLLLNTHRYYGTYIPSYEIENALNEKNKTRVINDLKRMKPKKTLIESCKSEAAVLVPFCTVDNKPSLLFTLRSSSLFKHRGEVSFPGGKRDKEDKSIVETAVRETVEELGIESNQIEIWAPLTPMPDRLVRIAITPVLGFLGEVDVKSIPFNHNEVSLVFTAFLEDLCHPKRQRYTKHKLKHGIFKRPVYFTGSFRIWGLTAVILDRVLSIMFTNFSRQNF